MKHRLLIKSTLCSHSKGVWQEETRDEEGVVLTEKKRLKAAPKLTDNSKFTVDEAKGTLTITDGTKTQVYPIPENALAFGDRD